VQSAKPRGLLFGKFARLLAAAVFSVQIAALVAVLCGFFYTPGWMFVHYVLQPAITDDMATNVIVGVRNRFCLDLCRHVSTLWMDRDSMAQAI
jgi:hypothetical protein